MRDIAGIGPHLELMEKFGYKSPLALKVAYVNALIALNKVSLVNKERVMKKVDNKIQINSHGRLVIPKKLVDSLGLDESDAFKVEKNGSGLYLKKVGKPVKTILKKSRLYSCKGHEYPALPA